MAKKIPSASINITSALRSILTNTSGQPQSAVFTQSLINSKITEAGLSAYAQLRSVIDHVVIDYAGSTYTVSIADVSRNLAVNVFDKATIVPIKGFRELVHTGDRLLPFNLNKGLKELPKATDILKRIVSYNRTFRDTPFAADKPYKGYTKAPTRDYNKTLDKALLSKGKNLKDFAKAVETFKATLSFVRKFKDYARTLDEIGISDKSTFSDSKLLKDRAVSFDKSKVTISKSLKDFARTLDEIGISDKATFSDAKLIKDRVVERDKAVLSASKNIKDKAVINSKSIYTLSKSFKDYATTIDDINIDDRVTFTEAKVVKDIQPSQDKSIIEYAKPLTEALVLAEKFGKTLSKSIRDYVRSIDILKVSDGVTYLEQLLERENTSGTLETFSRTVEYNRTLVETPQAADRPYKGFIKPPIKDYNVFAMDQIFITRFKVLASPHDFTTQSDHLLPFTIIKGLFERPTTPDILSRVVQYYRKAGDIKTPNEWTLVVKEPDGPAYQTNSNLYAIGYFLDDVIYTGPTVQFSRPVKDSVRRIYDNRTIQFSKSFKDYAKTLDEIGISDKATFTDTKILVDKNILRDTPYKGFTPAVKKDYQPVWKDKAVTALIKNLKDFARTLDDLQVADTATFADIKPLLDRNILRDASYKEFKPAAKKDYQPVWKDKSVTALTKNLKDFARTLDEIGIDDKATVVDAKKLKEYQLTLDRPYKGFTPSLKKDYQPVWLDKAKLSPTKASKDNQPLGFDGPAYQTNPNLYAIDYFLDNVLYVGPTVTYTKKLKDYQSTRLGPKNLNANDYVPGYIDNSTYIDDYQVVINKVKILKDYAKTLDDLQVADTSTFTDTKPFTDPRNYQFDKAKLSPTKFLKDYATTLDEIGIDDKTTFVDIKKLKEYQIQREKVSFATVKVLKDFARTLDDLQVADTSTFAETKVVKDFTAIQLDKSKNSLTKALKDFARTIDEIGIDDKTTFVDTKLLKDYQLTLERPYKGFTLSARIDYQRVWLDKSKTSLTKALKDFVGTLDEINIDDRITFVDTKVLKEYQIQREKLSFATVKVLRDYARTLDDLQVADTATFTETKPFSDPRNYQFDKAKLSPTKASKDNQPLGYDGPAYHIDPNEYALDYFIDNVIYTGPVFSSIKKLNDNQPTGYDGPAYHFNSEEYAIGYFIDDVIYFGPTVTYAKKLKDFATTLDETQIDDKVTFADSKLIVDRNIQLDKNKYSQTKVLKDTQYQMDYIGPFTYTKKLKDFARTIDDLQVADTATFTDTKPFSDPRNYQFDKSKYTQSKPFNDFTATQQDHIGPFTYTKKLKDYQSTRLGPRNLNAENYVPGYIDNSTYIDDYQILINKGKVLRDYARTLDDLQIADTSTFSDTKPLSDARNYQRDKAKLSPTKSVKDFTATQQDHIGPFTFVKSLKDFVFTDENLLFAKPITGDRQLQSTLDKTIRGVTKLLKDYSTTLDETQIDDRATFAETKILKDIQPTGYDGPAYHIDPNEYALDYFTDNVLYTGPVFSSIKKLKEYQLESEGPAIHTNPDEYAVGYFKDDVVYFGPVFVTSKILQDFARTLDDLQVADTSTFSDSKPFNDPRNYQFDKNKYTQVKPLKDSQYQIDHIGPFSYAKNLKDFARTLDDLQVADTATYSDTKLLVDRNIQLDKNKYTQVKPLKDKDIQPQIETVKNTTFKVLKDYQSTRLGPKNLNANDYVPGYIDNSTYIDDYQILINKGKVLRDYARTLDDLQIADTSTFADTKPFSDPRNYQLDKAKLRPTKVVKDFTATQQDHIGPFTFTKALKDFVFTDENIVFAKPVIGDRQLQKLLDKSIIGYTKIIRDYARTLDDLQVSDTSTFSDTKPVKDNQPLGFDGPAYQTNPNLYAIDYFLDNVLYVNPIVTYTKKLKDFARTIDEIGIDDKTTFVDTKILKEFYVGLDKPYKSFTPADKHDYQPSWRDKSTYQYTKVYKDYQYQIDHIGPFINTKVIRDFARTLDDLQVADTTTFTEVKPFTDPRNYQLDKAKLRPTKVVKDFTATQQDHIGPFTFTKALKEYQLESEGPAYHFNPNEYAIDYFLDNVIYTGPLFVTSKILRDYARTLDDLQVADTATFAETKPFSDPRNYQLDKAKLSPTKSLKDFTATQQDHVGPFTFTKSLKDFVVTDENIVFAKPVIGDRQLQRTLDKTTRGFTKILREFARTLDDLQVDDTATFADTKQVKDYQAPGYEGPAIHTDSNEYASGYFIDNVTYNGPKFITTKFIKDYQSTINGPRTLNANDYFPGYIDNSAYIADYNLKVNTTKPLKDFANAITSGLVSNWNYTTTTSGVIFFKEDFVGVSATLN
jgi:hypothetical protein